MNIEENLQLLQQTKEDIYQAIIAVGGELEASAPFSAYSAAIMAIRTASLYGEVVASVASPAFYVTGIPSVPATSSNYFDGYVIGIGKTEGFEPWSGNTFDFNNDVLVCEIFQKNNEGIYLTKNSDSYSGGGIALNAAHMTEFRQNNRLPIDVTSGGKYYVGLWKFHKVTSGSGDPYVLDEQLPVTISAATPTPEPVQYTYAISMDGGNTFGTGELNGTYAEGGWVKNYINLYYGSGDWLQSNFVAAGTVDPSNYSIVNNTEGAGITAYTSGFDSNEGKWYVAADSSTVQYSEAGEFFEVKAQSGNTDISNATLHVEIDVVQEADPCDIDPCSSPDCQDYDAEACGGGESIPEGLHKFTISESQWPDCAMMVEAFYNPGKLRDGETASQTVNIYSDPLGEPVNSITYNGLGYGEMYVENTNYNAGVYCTSSSDWSPCESGPLAFKLECRTAGTYYIEVVGHTDPKFFDANGTQIYPE